MNVAAIQKTVGTDADGDWGPLTQAAVDSYQRKRGVTVPLWLLAAERELGVHEIAGTAHNNARIVQYGQYTDLKPTNDEVPWCSDFANFCMAMAHIPRTNSAAAASWLHWGAPLKTWRYGCVAVFSRIGGHHVTFAVWEDANSLACLGGNQRDSVCVEVIPKTHLVGLRWNS